MEENKNKEPEAVEPAKTENQEGKEIKEVKEVKEEIKEPKEEKKDPATGEDVKVDLGKLEAEITEKNKIITEYELKMQEAEKLSAEVQAHKDKVTEYEDLLSKMIETKMEQVPEEYKDLIPDHMEIMQKLSWLEKAEAKGLFNKKEIKKPDVEVGKPMNVETPKVDTSKLSPIELMRSAFSSKK